MSFEGEGRNGESSFLHVLMPFTLLFIRPNSLNGFLGGPERGIEGRSRKTAYKSRGCDEMAFHVFHIFIDEIFMRLGANLFCNQK